MGSFNEIFLNTELKKDTPDEVIKILEYLFDDNAEPLYPGVFPDHPFFENLNHCRYMFLQTDYKHFEPFRRISKHAHCCYYFLEVHFSTKYSLYIAFLDWIKLYIDENKYPPFIGYYWHESDDMPRLLSTKNLFKDY